MNMFNDGNSSTCTTGKTVVITLVVCATVELGKFAFSKAAKMVKNFLNDKKEEPKKEEPKNEEPKNEKKDG